LFCGESGKDIGTVNKEQFVMVVIIILLKEHSWRFVKGLFSYFSKKIKIFLIFYSPVDFFTNFLQIYLHPGKFL